MIYLCGKMGGLSVQEASEWRDQFRYKYHDHFGHDQIMDPASYFNYAMEEGVDYDNRELFRFEKRMLLKCSIVVVNLTGIDTSVGSLMELAWAYDHGAAIIGFSEQADIKLHPWVEQTLDKKFIGENALTCAAVYVSSMYEVFDE